MVAVSPKPGDYCRVFKGSGSDSDYSSEPMEVVDLSAVKWGGHAARTVWRITAAAKRIMNDTEAPVFQYDPAGGTAWEALTPLEIWFGAGYIVTAPLAAPSVVKCLSGHYLTPTEFFGCATRSFVEKTLMEEDTAFGSEAVTRFPTVDDWDGKIEAFSAKKQAEVLSTGGVANSHVQGYHRAGGVAGNGPTLTFADTDQAVLSVAVADDDITVDLKTSGSNPVSTATEVIAALNASAAVQALGLWFVLPSGENGSGVVAAAGPFTFAGGADALAFQTMKGTRQLFQWYGDYANGDQHVGFGYVVDVDWIGKPTELLKAGLTVQGTKYPLRHVRG